MKITNYDVRLHINPINPTFSNSDFVDFESFFELSVENILQTGGSESEAVTNICKLNEKINRYSSA